MSFDLFIIGGGPAGYLAAGRAADHGLRTALAEEKSLGGVCLNEGCIPSKNLLHAAKMFDHAKSSSVPYGVRAESATVSLSDIVKRKNKIVRALTKGIEQTLKGKNVTVFNAKAIIRGQNHERLFEINVDGQIVTAKYLLICTGSDALIPPVKGCREALESGFALTNREILDLTEIPPRLAVIGGGVIGLEMAVAFQALGSQVTIIEMLDKIAAPYDDDISQQLQKECQQAGIEIHLGSKLTSVEGTTLSWENDKGQQSTKTFNRMLISTGRRPRVSGFGLDTLKVFLEHGSIRTDEKMRTSMPHVFAAGDVNGRSMLAHTAYREAEVAINTICGIEDEIDYRVIPSVVYTFPSEVATIGLSESEARQFDAQAKVVTLPLSYSGRYLTENERGRGFAKAILDRDGKHILGFSMCGTPASEIISTLSLALAQNTSVDHLKRVVFPHPTVGEIIRDLLYR